MSVGTKLILFSILTLSLYNVLLKRFPQKLNLLFWANLLSYLGFVAIYLFRSAILQHDLRALQELIFAYALDDFPLYVVIAGAFVSSMIISEKMLDGYDLSLVIPISQFGLLLASAGYIALGDPFQWSLLLGIMIVCCGTFLLSLSTTTDSLAKAMASGFGNIPRRLWLLVLGQAVCFTVSAVVSYIGTKETARTGPIMDSLRRFHLGPVAFHGAFYFNLGQQIFSVILFAMYILARKQYRARILSPIKNNHQYLICVVLFYIIAEYAYFSAFMITEDTTILLILDNVSIPITLILSFFFLKENIDIKKIMGSALIVMGGVVAGL
jgi:uncharacterized membrane protein